ncbi:MAG: hypothetical protein ACI9UK_002109, partial [Candidatus Krumholzibacteriia bacterium]
RRFDMVLTMSRLGDMDAIQMAGQLKELDSRLPIYNLSFNPRELQHLRRLDEDDAIDRYFLWNGDVRLLLGIIKFCEDLHNVAHDTRYGDVRCILLIEDSVRFYSSYLPLIYTEVLNQTQSLMVEGINLSHRLLRLRARPKILLANTFEEAWALYREYKNSLLGVISDGRFPWHGKEQDDAGVEFIRRIKFVDPHIPAVLQSTNNDLEKVAHEIGAGFIHKKNRKLLKELRAFMMDNFGFGDFVFRLVDGTEVGRAPDLKTMLNLLATVSGESIRYHASHDQFSNWLRARTEFGLATSLRPVKASEFDDDDDLRAYLIKIISKFRTESHRGVVADFSRRHFDASNAFVRIGGGSLGGKGRGLAFMNSILYRYGVTNRFPGTLISVPPTAVVGTDVFDQFMKQGDLREHVLGEATDREINDKLLGSEFPEKILSDLEAFLDQVRYPLAVRSSSLLEDSQFQPFAGVYATYMLANSHPDLAVRLAQLIDAIKLVYASTYSHAAKSYIEASNNRIEEEKMAVIIQQMVGQRYGQYDYPHFSGAANSANFYPAHGMEPKDGVVVVALGLGRTVVEGGKALRFSPAHPTVLPQFGTVDDWLKLSQQKFIAVDVSDPEAFPNEREDFNLVHLDLDVAEKDGTLNNLGSVYSADNNMIYDGLGRAGTRLVSFAHILKTDLFPLAKIMALLLELGRRTMSTEVEIEFAVVLGDGEMRPHQFGFLQIRPLAAGYTTPDIPDEMMLSADTLVATDVALGNGRQDDIYDIVYVPRETFNREKTEAIATEIAEHNRQFVEKGRPYMLVGPGRWGSSDRWLGIPVRWDQISGAGVIVETDLDDFKVTPSEGTHFFQNLTSFQVGYLTVNTTKGESLCDWNWLDEQEATSTGKYTRHVALAEPLTVLIDGRTSQGVVLKPGAKVDTVD